tara:strand:+ start:1066 stop:1263 length:198 start_codon:yes stop_codon:yes gene_type:complete
VAVAVVVPVQEEIPAVLVVVEEEMVLILVVLETIHQFHHLKEMPVEQHHQLDLSAVLEEVVVLDR